MTDLHTHILPGLDDGAGDLETAVSLVRLQADQGVTQIALTSHFSCEEMGLDDFLARRAEALAVLRGSSDPAVGAMEFKLGCEIYFSPNIRRLDLGKLCLEGTDLLLLELPVNYCPQFLESTLLDLQAQGFLPLIAHAERYAYVRSDPSLLARWIENGALIQVNAGSLLRDRAEQKRLLQLIRWGLVHVVSSDTHSPGKRPPLLREAMDLIGKSLGDATAEQLRRNARALFGGELPPDQPFHYPRRFLGRWI